MDIVHCFFFFGAARTCSFRQCITFYPNNLVIGSLASGFFFKCFRDPIWDTKKFRPIILAAKVLNDMRVNRLVLSIKFVILKLL